MTYAILYDENNEPLMIQHTELKCWIPLDPANRDYQEYLAWVAEGNEAEPWA